MNDQTTITLSPEQEAAAQACQQWLDDFPDTRRPFFVIEGFAGTGKSFSVNEILRRTGMKPVYMTYTGKAALVLNKYHGLDARTIHSTIYRLKVIPDSVFEHLYKQLEEAKGDDAKKEIKQEIADLEKPEFVLDDEAFSFDDDNTVLVLDECSMVDDDILRDLMSFGLPIIALGDPGQLPPIGGEGALFKGMADARLEEIRRQALDSPIIKWSMFARQKRTLPMTAPEDWKEDECAKVPYTMLSEEDQLNMIREHDIVICWKNQTRKMLNVMVRKAMGLHAKDAIYPVVGDTLIITRNDKNLGIFNGQFGQVLEIKREFDAYVEMMVKVEGVDEPLKLNIHRRPFEEYADPKAKDKYRPWDYKGTQEADFGYAITCHKAQGSQWDNVLVYEENVFNWYKPLNDGSDPQDNRARWLYTAITRAAKKLTIIAGRV